MRLVNWIPSPRKLRWLPRKEGVDVQKERIVLPSTIFKGEMLVFGGVDFCNLRVLTSC